MAGKSWIANLCDVLGVDEKELDKHKQTPAGGVVEKLMPKKQDKANSGAGGTSVGGSANSNKNTVTINKPPSPTKTAGTAADDPLAAYCDDLAKQKQEKSLQTLWGMTGADNIWGNKEPPKVATAAETLRPWGLDKTTGQAATDDGVTDYQRPGSDALVNPAGKADSDPLALLKNKWQQERQQTGGGVVTGDVELPDWMNNDGHLTLPTFGDTMQYYNSTNKEGGASAENNPDEGAGDNYIILYDPAEGKERAKKLKEKLENGNAGDKALAVLQLIGLALQERYKFTRAEYIKGMSAYGIAPQDASIAFDLTFGDLTGSAIGSAAKGISGLKAAKTAETITEGAGDAPKVEDVAEVAGKSSDDLNWDKIISKKGETRIDHVNRHQILNNQRASHGVFNGNVRDIVNGAWKNRGNVEPIDDGMGGKIYNIPYENAGYEGGSINTGAKMNYVTIIVMDDINIITAFPSFGNYIR